MGFPFWLLVRDRHRLLFRITAANALVVMPRHPGGDSSPSEADINVTRDSIRVGLFLKIEAIDPGLIRSGNRSSLRELGYFYA
jgi:DNA repair protein RadC